MLSHYLIPLAPFLLIGINSALCLFFFLGVKHDRRAMQLRGKRRETAKESTLEALKIELAELKVRVLDAEERAGVLVPPPTPPSGLNLNKRTQVIRMSRRGEQADKIAASLNLPRREVELLLKVHGSVIYSQKNLKATVTSDSAASNAVSS